MNSRLRPQLIDGVGILDGRAHVTVCRGIEAQLVEIEGLPTLAQRYFQLLQPLPLLGAEGITGLSGATRLVADPDEERPWIATANQLVAEAIDPSLATGLLWLSCRRCY